MSHLIILVLFAFATDVFGVQAQTPSPVKFTGAVLKPNLNEATKHYDIVVHGNLENVPAQVQIRVTLRETALEGKEVNTSDAILITQKDPVSPSQQKGITREEKKPLNGSYLATMSNKRYDAKTYKYEVKFDFETAEGGLISTYIENKSEWIPVPLPK